MGSRIKYYLLDWKDKNMDQYLKIHPDKRLRELTNQEAHDLFIKVTKQDTEYLLELSKKS